MLLRRLVALVLLLFTPPLAASAEADLKVTLYGTVRMAEAGIVTNPSDFNSHPLTERRMTCRHNQAEHWETLTKEEASR